MTLACYRNSARACQCVLHDSRRLFFLMAVTAHCGGAPFTALPSSGCSRCSAKVYASIRTGGIKPSWGAAPCAAAAMIHCPHRQLECLGTLLRHTALSGSQQPQVYFDRMHCVHVCSFACCCVVACCKLACHDVRLSHYCFVTSVNSYWYSSSSHRHFQSICRRAFCG